ncbi:LysM peptidoglycan-binding domain-containing protein [Aliivibrio finisterrensis]|uniref:peptidoglycan DD-metalloendopeptidase family protein n=1 Tax=Aliivibrio finisterrensis TaxID=511998 RepID=UPI001021427E|nr:peptidoglycan DD-metalloendopeptidase family protein [Aliivibrio finisterrensis]RYU68051.1 LysM peptidoglycan-binding domain-containing protein [Aliivibrio finisterrensis]RYU71719.1 LysM peptidoglycan-binding domain-containing protein [Aliivibrio finisterrensis]RYU75394.1 LysM peptidoglycan-binding domain-containing protein [Aliivibrio finisterrensis]
MNKMIFIPSRLWLIAALFSLLLSGCSMGPHRPAPVSSVNNTSTSSYGGAERGSYRGSYYRVEKGDTLYFISYVTNKDVKELIAYNELQAPYVIHPGQKIKLWGPKYVAPAYGDDRHLVSKKNISPTTTATAVAVVPVANNKPVSSSKSVTPSNKKTSTVQKESTKKVENPKPKEYVDSNKSITSSKPKPVAKPAPKSTPKPKPVEKKSEKVDSWLWPTKGRVIAKFSTGDQGNKGIDIAGQRGQDVISTAKGTVVYAGNALRGYGNLIIIKHNDDYLSAYAHNESLFVKEGQNIAAGQKIASMGSSSSSSVRLHFEIRFRGKSVNPQRYLP